MIYKTYAPILLYYWYYKYVMYCIIVSNCTYSINKMYNKSCSFFVFVRNNILINVLGKVMEML